MKGRFSFLVLVIVMAILVSKTTMAHVLLDPPRRWFPADLSKEVIVDVGGKPGVTSPDPDGGVTAALAAVTAWNATGLTILSSSSDSPKRTQQVRDLIPELYLHGLAQGDGF